MDGKRGFLAKVDADWLDCLAVDTEHFYVF